MILRPYQSAAVDAIRAALDRLPILALPTGAGKTVIALELIRGFDGTVVFLTHRRELVKQARARLGNVGVLMGSERSVERVTVASVQTLCRHEIQADLVIADEAHHATSDTWKRVLDRFSYRVGLTATPYRLDGSPLGDVFGEIIEGPSVRELISQGVLMEPRVYAPPGPDLRGVHKRGGEYVHGELQLRVEKPKLVGDIVEHWKKHANGLRTVAFAVGVQHSRMIADAFGPLAAHIDGSTPGPERDRAFAALKAGEIRVLVNCDLIGEGWDLPELECAILARPTASLALHRQQIGRIMRVCPGKSAIVLDHAGNSHRHGLVTDRVEVSLTGKAKKLDPAPPSCRECFAVMPGGYPCQECGFIPETEIAVRDIGHEDGELVEFVSVQDKKEWYAGIVASASLHGYRLGWAKNKYKEKYGSWPRLMGEIEAAYVCLKHEPEPRPYGIVCARCLRKVGRGIGARL